MTGDETSFPKLRQGVLDKFEPGGESEAIEDPNEREKRLNRLPPEEKELAFESARLADLCQYFSRQRVDIPADLLDRIGELSKLQPKERVRDLSNFSQALIEYLNRVGSGPQLWQ